MHDECITLPSNGSFISFLALDVISMGYNAWIICSVIVFLIDGPNPHVFIPHTQNSYLKLSS